MCADPFMGFFSLGVPTKKGHYTKSERYFTYLWGIFHSTKFNKNWPLSGVVHIINHTKFDNDRSRKYKVMEGRILACSIGMACRLCTVYRFIMYADHVYTYYALFLSPPARIMFYSRPAGRPATRCTRSSTPILRDPISIGSYVS